MTPGAASPDGPLAATPDLRPEGTDPAEVSATVTYTATIEQLLARDFPDFPILPGVCVLEYVRLSAEANPPRGGLRLRTIERARFTGAAFPGDDLTVELTWTPVSEDENEWDCRAGVSTPRGAVGVACLRYVAGAPL